MDGSNLALLVIAAYVAVLALVRLMLARRNQLFQELGNQVNAAQSKRHRARAQADQADEAA